MDKAYHGLDLVEVASRNIGVNLDDQIVLIDTLGGDGERVALEDLIAKYPAKVSFNIMIVCVRGELDFRLNLSNYALTTNDFLIIPEGAIGELRRISDGTRLAAMAFSSRFSNISSNLEHTIQLQKQFYATPKIRLSDAAMDEYLTVYQLMKAKIKETGNPFRMGALLGYMQVLTNCAFYYLLAPSDGGEKVGRQQDLYTRFIQLVGQHFRIERGIAFYANLLCVTPKYLSQQVRRASGRFAGDWIREYVILEAKAMLKSRHYTVQQVTHHLNFPSQSFFGKYFKNATGLSPTEFRGDV